MSKEVCPEFPSINEWLDLHGIDRAYKKDMKKTYLKEKEEACHGTGRKPSASIKQVGGGHPEERLPIYKSKPDESPLLTDEVLAFIESYFVTTIEPDGEQMHHIDNTEWQSVKVRAKAQLAKDEKRWKDKLDSPDREGIAEVLENADIGDFDRGVWLAIADQIIDKRRLL